MSTARSFTERAISPSAAAPTQLLLGEAFSHVGQIPLVKALWHPTPLIIIGIVCGVGLWGLPSLTLALMSGGTLAILALVIFYLFWYARFLDRNHAYGILCPRCTSRMWQLCCVRCRETLPPLAFMGRGIFLSSCPHCSLPLSPMDETMRVWCSTCAYDELSPNHLYRKPMIHIVWVVEGSVKLRDGNTDWQETAHPAPSRTILFRSNDPHSSCLLLLVDYRSEQVLDFDSHLISSNQLLLATKAIPQAFINPYWERFPGRLFRV